MYATTSFVTPILYDLVENFHSRKLLFLPPINQPSNSTNPPISTNIHDSTKESSYLGDGNFDANVIMVLSVLLCALLCSLCLNSIIRCALKCSNIVVMSGDRSTVTTPLRATNTGIKKKALKTFTTVNYSNELNLYNLDSECVICLSEFTNGEKLRLLPKCNHGFHVRCIDKWLSSHSSCPKCRQCLIETCKKIVGSQGSSSQPQSMLFPVQETIVTITPLEHEGLVRDYREVS